MFRDLQWLRHRSSVDVRADSPVSSSGSFVGPVVGRGRANAHGDSLVELEESCEKALSALDKEDFAAISDANALCIGGRDAQDIAYCALAEHAASIAEQLCVNDDFLEVHSVLEINGKYNFLSSALHQRDPRLVVTVFNPPENPVYGDDITLEADRNHHLSAEDRHKCCGNVKWCEELEINHDAVIVQLASASMPELATLALYRRAFEGVRNGGLLLVHESWPEGVSQENAESSKLLIASARISAAGFVNVWQIGGSLGQLLIGKKPVPEATFP